MASKHREHKRNRKRARSAEDRIDLDEVRKRLAKPGKTMTVAELKKDLGI